MGAEEVTGDESGNVSPSEEHSRECGSGVDTEETAGQCVARQVNGKSLLTPVLLLQLFLSLWPVTSQMCDTRKTLFLQAHISLVGVLTAGRSNERLISPVATLRHVDHESKEFLPLPAFMDPP